MSERFTACPLAHESNAALPESHHFSSSKHNPLLAPTIQQWILGVPISHNQEIGLYGWCVSRLDCGHRLGFAHEVILTWQFVIFDRGLLALSSPRSFVYKVLRNLWNKDAGKSRTA